MSIEAYKSLLSIVILSSSFLFGARSLHAQGDPQAPAQETPKPAGVTPYPIPAMGDQQDEENPNNAMTPDTTPLTGVQEPTLGSPELRHSYWQSGLQWSGSIQSNSYNQTSNSSWLINNFLAGNLTLLKAWSGSQLSVNYSAGGYISSDSSQGNGYYHQLAFAQSFHWKRMSIQLLDQFSYLPQSSFGFGGGTGLGFPGTGGPLGPVIPGIGNGYVPNQGIYAAIGDRYSNTASVQITYQTTPRGSLTLSGTYGILNYVQAGNVDNDTLTGTIGYNYLLTRKDTIGVFYRFNALHFPGQPEAYGDHSANAAYGRKLTGRLALQLYGGPDFTTSRLTATGAMGGPTTHGVNTGVSLTCGFGRGGFSVGYNHAIFGGSGVLTGSTGDSLNLNAYRQLGRIWSGHINMGYSRNAPITSIPNTPSQTFNTWNAGGGVSRALGRSATLAIAYNAVTADYGLAGCVGTACSSNQVYQYVTISVQWHTRPFVLP